MRMRVTFSLVFAVLLVQTSARSAEPFTVTVPGQGWTIAFESPSLQNYKGQSNDKAFQFQAMGEGGFNLSIFVEEAGAKEGGHAACADNYWPLAKRNPMIDQESAKTTKTDNFVRVAYNIKAGDGANVKIVANINYYFAFQGKWIDVHISRYPSTAADADILASFEKSLTYKITKP
jgi:hypothetical protein